MHKTLVTKNGTEVVLTVKNGGAVRYDFEANSKAKRPVPYSFTGTVETYMLDPNREDTGYVNFSYAKKDSGTPFRWATWSARERWRHVVDLIRREVYPAVREWAATAEYQAAIVDARRRGLLIDLGEAQRNYERRVRDLAAARDEIAGAEARLASFDEQHGTGERETK